MIKLTQRLQKTAELITPCKNLADIGTDHAYLPVYAIENKIAEYALACDINEGPLNNAENTVREYSLNDKISLRISDGLKEVEPSEADCIVIAGMGGELISDILSACNWIKNDKQLVLQPMTHFENLRKFLCDNNFIITKEVTVKEGRRIYLALSAAFSGENNQYDDWYYYTGNLIHSNKPTDIEFCNKIISRLENKCMALKNSGNDFEYDKKILEAIKNERAKRYL